ncbi:hypothetical protein C0995_001204 [Termitomyces sp. Mi166|nr:hypothetical protein C0995_001204 [Termitomyces sp. Mi166\
MDTHISSLINVLRSVLRDKHQYKRLLQYKGRDAQRFLDCFQWLLDVPELDSQLQRSLIVTTQRLSTNSGLYPACYELKDVLYDGQRAVNAGGFADIYKGNFQASYERSDIVGAAITPKYLDGLYRFQHQVCIVLPWMDNGDLTTYLNNNLGAPRKRLAADVANGLCYLHQKEIIHGDMKSPNVLIDHVGRALLTDFGISSVASGSGIAAWTSQSSVASKGGTVRWQAPELFSVADDKEVKNTFASDVYSYGCVCFQECKIFTGDFPFAHIQRDATIIALVQQSDVRPQRPQAESPPWNEWGLTEEIWSLIEHCWKKDPSQRPTATEMSEHFTRLSADDTLPTWLPPQTIGTLWPAGFRRQLSKPLTMETIEAINRTLRDDAIGTGSIIEPDSGTLHDAAELGHTSPATQDRLGDRSQTSLALHTRLQVDGTSDVRGNSPEGFYLPAEDPQPGPSSSSQLAALFSSSVSLSAVRLTREDVNNSSNNISIRTIPPPPSETDAVSDSESPPVPSPSPYLLPLGNAMIGVEASGPTLAVGVKQDNLLLRDLEVIGRDEPPLGWEQLMRPGGQLYFYNASKRIVTECRICDPVMLSILSNYIDKFDAFTASRSLTQPEDTNLVLIINKEDDGRDRCGYYYACASTRSVFWLEAVDMHVAGVPELYLEYQYWLHWDLFPEVNSLEALVANTISNVRPDLQNDSSNVLYTIPDLTGREMTDIIEDLRMKERFENFDKQHGPSLLPNMKPKTKKFLNVVPSVFRRAEPIEKTIGSTSQDGMPMDDDIEVLRKAIHTSLHYSAATNVDARAAVSKRKFLPGSLGKLFK